MFTHFVKLLSEAACAVFLSLRLQLSEYHGCVS